MPKISKQLHSRPPLERMLRIHEKLQSNSFPNCSRLACEIEVSTRTIKRDVDFMKYRLDLPIEYHPQRYGYYYSERVDRFPTLPITEAEIFALLVAHKAIAQYRGTPFEHLLEAAFRKLTGQLDTSTSFSFGNLDEAFSFRPFAPEETDLGLFQNLLTAIRKNQAIQFAYKKLGAKKSEQRTAHPYHLACVDNRWYLFAFDTVRQAMREFVLTRMSKLEVTDKTFIRRKSFKLDKYLRGSFGVFTGKPEDEFEVVVEFDAWAADLLRGRRWHWSQSVDELPGGEIRMRMRLNNLEEIERWVLEWGIHATVIAPLALADRIENIALELRNRYAVFKRKSGSVVSRQ
jgi:predicted DNA-binding transcriptional regulator YafY